MENETTIYGKTVSQKEAKSRFGVGDIVYALDISNFEIKIEPAKILKIILFDDGVITYDIEYVSNKKITTLPHTWVFKTKEEGNKFLSK